MKSYYEIIGVDGESELIPFKHVWSLTIYKNIKHPTTGSQWDLNPDNHIVETSYVIETPGKHWSFPECEKRKWLDFKEKYREWLDIKDHKFMGGH